MRKIILSLGLAGLVAGIGGFALNAGSENTTVSFGTTSAIAEEEVNILATGAFRDADPGHRGTGTVEVYEEDGKRFIRFSDFQVTRGPDLKVWLVATDNVRTARDVLNADYVSLGKLKNNRGNQKYRIPKNVDLAQYGTVVIWCEQFRVLFSPAALKDAS